MTRTARATAVASVVVVAAVLRVWAADYDLPYIYHPDEPVNVGITQRMFTSGDANPHFFGYPSLLYYLNTVVYALYYLMGHADGTLRSMGDVAPLVELAMGVTKAPQPALIALSRGLTIAFGAGTVLITFLAGLRLLGNDWTALFAATIVAVSPANVALSRLITPDTFVTFFAAATLLAATYVMDRGTWRDYLLAGVLAGLTASAKYNGGLVILSVVAAHFLRVNRTPRNDRMLLAAFFACAAGFVAASPFAVLAPAEFLAGLALDAQVYTKGHAGMEGDTLRWYIAHMGATAGVVYVFSGLEILRGLWARSRPLLLLAAFPLVYFTFIAAFEVRNDRTFLPITPFLFLLAASFLSFATGHASRIASLTPKHVRAATLAAVLVALFQPAGKAVRDTLQLLHSDSRRAARLWIEENIPAGSRIAIEPYAPFLDPGRYAIQAFERLTIHDPDWYASKGFQYVVASEGLYGRFFREPDRYAVYMKEYERLFARLPLVREFPDHGYEIRVYAASADGANVGLR